MLIILRWVRRTAVYNYRSTSVHETNPSVHRHKLSDNRRNRLRLPQQPSRLGVRHCQRYCHCWYARAEVHSDAQGGQERVPGPVGVRHPGEEAQGFHHGIY